MLLGPCEREHNEGSRLAVSAKIVGGALPSRQKGQLLRVARALIIVFSFNRAMQADATLRSIQRYVAGGEVDIAVVWRCDCDHRDSYLLLRERHQSQSVMFHEELLGLRPWLPALAALRHPRNLRKWQQHPYLRKLTGFKPLVERILAGTDCRIASFQTDDCIYYREEALPEFATTRIMQSPSDWSYRAYVGADKLNSPNGLCTDDQVIVWDYYDPGMRSHWAYPFSVDCTFYNVSFLRRFLGGLFYSNPISLEHFGVRAARRREFLRNGMSPHTATAVSLPLNKVDFTYAANTHGDVSLDTLRDAFLDGFQLEYDLSAAATNSVYVPGRFWLCKGEERREILVG
jgi:hypothetical protein